MLGSLVAKRRSSGSLTRPWTPLTRACSSHPLCNPSTQTPYSDQLERLGTNGERPTQAQLREQDVPHVLDLGAVARRAVVVRLGPGLALVGVALAAVVVEQREQPAREPRLRRPGRQPAQRPHLQRARADDGPAAGRRARGPEVVRARRGRPQRRGHGSEEAEQGRVRGLVRFCATGAGESVSWGSVRERPELMTRRRSILDTHRWPTRPAAARRVGLEGDTASCRREEPEGERTGTGSLHIQEGVSLGEVEACRRFVFCATSVHVCTTLAGGALLFGAGTAGCREADFHCRILFARFTSWRPRFTTEARNVAEPVVARS